MTTTKKTRKIGRFLFALILAGALGVPAKVVAEEKKGISVIAGTVFREPGFALPGAVVTLEEAEPPAKGKRQKPQTFISDSHGEFAFRLPGSEKKFKVTAAAKGFGSQTKETTASPGVRMDVFFELKPAN
jgi:hypothetical protein